MPPSSLKTTTTNERDRAKKESTTTKCKTVEEEAHYDLGIPV